MEHTGHLPQLCFSALQPTLLRGFLHFKPVSQAPKIISGISLFFPIYFGAYLFIQIHLHMRGSPSLIESCCVPSDHSVWGTCYAKLPTSLHKPACFSLCMGQSVSTEPLRRTRLLSGNRFPSFVCEQGVQRDFVCHLQFFFFLFFFLV